MTKRSAIQLVSTVLANSKFIPGLKCVNYPFLNCYSCPLAIGACPVGTVQYFVITRQLPLLVVGVLGVVGSIWGRMSCAWLCPFGFIQELLYKIPWPGRKLTIRTRRYAWVKYVVLAALVLGIPYVTLEPWFCKLCPAGTLEAGLPWLAISPPLRDLVGLLFWVKIALLVVFVVSAIVISRPFCRFACPLGAAYGLTNRFSRVRLEVDTDRCTSCGKCGKVCPMGLQPESDVNSTDCIRCRQCESSCRHIKLSSPALLPRPASRRTTAPTAEPQSRQ